MIPTCVCESVLRLVSMFAFFASRNALCSVFATLMWSEPLFFFFKLEGEMPSFLSAVLFVFCLFFSIEEDLPNFFLCFFAAFFFLAFFVTPAFGDLLACFFATFNIFFA